MESEERRGPVSVSQRGWYTGGKKEEAGGTIWLKKKEWKRMKDEDMKGTTFSSCTETT
jgi:hypothetical protein